MACILIIGRAILKRGAWCFQCRDLVLLLSSRLMSVDVLLWVSLRQKSAKLKYLLFLLVEKRKLWVALSDLTEILAAGDRASHSARRNVPDWLICQAYSDNRNIDSWKHLNNRWHGNVFTLTAWLLLLNGGKLAVFKAFSDGLGQSAWRLPHFVDIVYDSIELAMFTSQHKRWTWKHLVSVVFSDVLYNRSFIKSRNVLRPHKCYLTH